ncbi:unnamed protein product [Hermetia illucens]|uniref:lysozyme n=1 Tax=Hermetia illucens TaxID=343691 RepID=A0A7R8YXA6_HERIL|nr:lysozyme 2-like [Hermetia illucens]CAD7088803.1 unnamed protein product [Hermetia illucens]
MKAIAVIALLVLVACAQAKVYTRCEMARILYHDHGVKNLTTLANWICLIEHESGFNDEAVGALNSNGTRDYGLFQINNQYWCKGNVASSDSCKIACTALLGNLDASWKCAQLVYKEQGFKAWYGWLYHCNGTAPSVASCI